jgi:polyferredoxin
MTSNLHLPIPALILGGPIFRGSGFFMPILFVSTILLIGAAWCSFLCYIGSWDNLLCRCTRSPKALPLWWKNARILILIFVILLTFLFRAAGLSSTAAAGLAILFGLGGIGVMFLVSRKIGTMAHCTIYCPIGLLADLLGHLNPFRIGFKNDCDECGACSLACRYNALTESDIQKRRPGISCTLCGDCIVSCSKGALEYRFMRLKPDTAHKAFVILIVSFHAVFLGVARI